MPKSLKSQFMKKILLSFILALSLFSCSKQPDDLIHNIKTEEAGWVVKEKGQKPVMSYEEYYQISPTWGQAVYYAKQTSDFYIFLVFGIIILAAAGTLFYMKATDSKHLSEQFNNIAVYIIFVLTIAGSYSIFSKPGDIRWNNDKWVKKEVYNKAIEKANSTQPIWDSLETHHLIIGGK